MFTIVKIEKGGSPERLQFDDNTSQIRIGRVQGNDIVLPKGNVSKNHARIVVRNGEFVIHDDHSTNGTYVNGARINAPRTLTGSDKIFIGEFTIYIDDGSSPQPRAGGPPPPPNMGGSGPPPPPIQADSGRSDLDDDLFPAMGDDFGEAGSAKPPTPPQRRKPPPSLDDDFGDDLFGGGGAPPQRQAAPPKRPAPPKRQAPPSLEDDLGLEDPLGAAPPAKATPPQRQAPPKRPAPPKRQAPPSLEDDLGLEDPLGKTPMPDAEPPQQQAVPPQQQAAPPQRQAAPPQRQAAPPQRQAAPPQRQAAPPQRQAAPPQRQAPPQGGRGPAPPTKPVKQAKGAPKSRGKKSKIDPKLEKVSLLQKKIHDRLIERMDLRRMNLDEIAEDELWDKTDGIICDIVDQMAANNEIPSFIDQDELIKDVLNEALGLGPLQDFLEDDTISEIMVNHSKQIYLEINGKLVLSEKVFSSDQAVLGVIERIVAPIGRRIDESSPLVDARLKDGSRVNAIIPPLALKGPTITIRKFKKDVLGSQELVNYGTLTKGMADFLKMCVLARKNMIISGGTGSGKTTTLNIISNFIPENERIITIEDAAELQIQGEHWIQLESRPPNIEGTGAITIRDLMKNTLRMRPDRILVGECRSGEALDMLQAMNTGHDGSLTTVHANTPRDALARLETMVLMSGMELPIKAIRSQIASAVDIIVQQTRFSDGSRKLTFISEITGMEGDIITMQDIFQFKQEGYDETNKVLGKFSATGFMPKFYDDLRRKGIPVDMTIFREN